MNNLNTTQSPGSVNLLTYMKENASEQGEYVLEIGEARTTLGSFGEVKEILDQKDIWPGQVTEDDVTVHDKDGDAYFEVETTYEILEREFGTGSNANAGERGEMAVYGPLEQGVKPAVPADD